MILYAPLPPSPSGQYRTRRLPSTYELRRFPGMGDQLCYGSLAALGPPLCRLLPMQTFMRRISVAGIVDVGMEAPRPCELRISRQVPGGPLRTRMGSGDAPP